VSWQDKIRDPDCTLCPLHEEAEHVCLMGSGSRKSRIMVVGEAPGAREDESHQAFVGPAGRLLRDSLVAVGISPEDCYITNAAKCRPPDNRTPEWSEIKVCRDAYFWQEFEAVDPDYLLLLGNSALRATTGRARITHNRGSTFDVRGKVGLATFHPAYVLRSPYHGSAYRADIQKLANLVGGQSAAQVSKTAVKIVRTKEHLKWLRRQLLTHDEVAIDFETNYHKKHQEYSYWHKDFRLVSVAFTWEEGQGAFLPLHHPESPWKDPDAVFLVLKRALERPGLKLFGHNFPFDARCAASVGVYLHQTFDTMLGAHMLDENRLKGLEPLSEILLGVEPYKISVGDVGAHNVPLGRLALYNSQDTDYTFRLRNLLKDQFKEEPRVARVFSKLMMPAANAMVPMQMGGVWIDPVRYRKRLKATIKKRDRVEAELRESCGDINLRSPDQVANWLFGPRKRGGLQLPIIERSKKTKKPSTREAVILSLARESPELRKLLEYRKWEMKYLRTYFAQWSHVDEHSRFHPEYKLFGTVTGRLSGDFQQVPRDPWMRSIIGAPPGWLFVEADYSQIELRLAAWIANERRLLRLFAMGEDAHLNTAVAILRKRPEDITIEERKHGKSVNFGFLYSMGPKKFVEYCFENYELIITQEQAEAYYDGFHRSYPTIRKWHDRQRRLVHRYERVHSPIGRVRHLPTVRSSDAGVQREAERQAINSPVQSLASDLMLLSLVRLSDRLPSTIARIVGTVHDSILFEVREEHVDEIVPVIHDTMVDMSEARRKFGLELTVPIEVEVKVGQHWGEGKKWEF
jgi:uracil-DNA glycosylase family 4